MKLNSLRLSDAYMHIWLVALLVASHYLNQCWNIVNLDPRNSEILSTIQVFYFKKYISKCHLQRWRPSCLCLNVLTKISYSFPDIWYHIIALQKDQTNQQIGNVSMVFMLVEAWHWLSCLGAVGKVIKWSITWLTIPELSMSWLHLWKERISVSPL